MCKNILHTVTFVCVINNEVGICIKIEEVSWMYSCTVPVKSFKDIVTVWTQAGFSVMVALYCSAGGREGKVLSDNANDTVGRVIMHKAECEVESTELPGQREQHILRTSSIYTN